MPQHGCQRYEDAAADDCQRRDAVAVDGCQRRDSGAAGGVDCFAVTHQVLNLGTATWESGLCSTADVLDVKH